LIGYRQLRKIEEIKMKFTKKQLKKLIKETVGRDTLQLFLVQAGLAPDEVRETIQYVEIGDPNYEFIDSSAYALLYDFFMDEGLMPVEVYDGGESDVWVLDYLGQMINPRTVRESFRIPTSRMGFLGIGFGSEPNMYDPYRKYRLDEEDVPEPLEDAWEGGENLENPVDYAGTYTEESNKPPGTVDEKKIRTVLKRAMKKLNS